MLVACTVLALALTNSAVGPAFRDFWQIQLVGLSFEHWVNDALMALLPWELRARLEREAPTHFEAPTGTMLAIDYEAEQGPTIAVRLQELFGLNTHPSIAKGKVPLVLELLSPAQRPVQVTRDLPGFWRGSYAAVRSDLRGRYPRHPWPEDPATALPTRRVKPRGT